MSTDQREPGIFEVLCHVAFLIVGGAGLAGYALLLGWRWFVVPLGVPAISFWHALGIRWIFALLSMSPTPKDPDKTTREKIHEAYGRLLWGPLIGLGLAWLFHHFMAG